MQQHKMLSVNIPVQLLLTQRSAVCHPLIPVENLWHLLRSAL